MIIIKNDQSFFPTLNNNISKLIFIRVPEEFNLIFVPISIQNLLSSPLKHFSHYYVLIIEDLYRRYLEKKITRTHQKITYLNYRTTFARDIFSYLLEIFATLKLWKLSLELIHGPRQTMHEPTPETLPLYPRIIPGDGKAAKPRNRLAAVALNIKQRGRCSV